MSASATSAPIGSRRGVLVVLGIGGALLLVAVLAGRPAREGPPLDPRSDTPSGTSALVEVLRRLDAEVHLSVGLPTDDEDIALVLVDDLDDDQRQQLLDWTRRGGRLVVASPGPLTPGFAEPSLLDEPVTVLAPGTCTIDALSALGELDTGGAAFYEVPDGADSCYSGDDGTAYVVADDLGDGTLVAIGGPGFAVNDLLDDADNAPFAAALLAPQPGTSVRFVEPPIPAGGGDKSLLELMPAGLRRAILQLGIAFVLYALWRSIRVGKPIVEEQPVPIAGSELVAAVGRLLARTRTPSAAAAVLRADLRRDVASRFGLPRDASAESIADTIAERTSADRATVLDAVADAPVTTDEELLSLARAAAAVRQEVFR